jgi:HTH-type transcriptional regulator/antitoxin HigA
MTLTFNPKKYQELLSRHLPKIIRTEEENERALAIVEELMHRKNRTPEEDELYELLIFLIENFEGSFYLQEATTSHSMLLFLMEQQSVNKNDIAKILGTYKIASDLVEGKKKITQEQAKLLGKLFHVDCSLFI